MQKSPEMFARLKLCCQDIHQGLYTVPKMTLLGHPESPVKHLVITDPEVDRKEQEEALAKIISYCFKRHVVLVSSGVLDTEYFPRKPSLRIAVNNDLLENEIFKVCCVLEDAAKKIL